MGHKVRVFPKETDGLSTFQQGKLFYRKEDGCVAIGTSKFSAVNLRNGAIIREDFPTFNWVPFEGSITIFTV